MATADLPTQSQEWGFFGTVSRLDQVSEGDAAFAWRVAMRAVTAATGAAPEAVRDFLDSRHGRHFADDVANELATVGPFQIEAAVDAAIVRWQGWRIGRTTSRAEGIPVGLPSLSGWVGQFEVLAEARA